MRRLPLLLWLGVVWVALWGDLSIANVASGTVAALVVVAMTPAPPRCDAPRVRIRPLELLRFELHFIRKLFVSTAIVAWEIVTPTNRVREGVVAVPLRGWSPFVTTLVANAVSLTPGTITLDIDGDGRTLYVHVLHLHEAASIRRDVQDLEALAIRAFGGRSDPGPPGAIGGEDVAGVDVLRRARTLHALVDRR